jgi:hypothetical protein
LAGQEKARDSSPNNIIEAAAAQASLDFCRPR